MSLTSDLDPVTDGTLISSPINGLLYYSPFRYRDGAAAFRLRSAEFRMVANDSPFMALLRARLAALNTDLPGSPGEYVELN